ncbi:uncharacterized protein LOC131945793 [Physella acuta]|uniref:uncharacterized protein LOC131945793 n=1 Tax=Physella acuta TaxID=109671 RepID=UPI0027DDBF63|nr:uncharacterized protein LOC131945793 [Physella acuta]XP_059162388.1 uncharacterized protein LOC131945793 [Physella acuta]
MSKKGAPNVKSKRPVSGKKGKKEEVEDPMIAILRKLNDDLHAENSSLKESSSLYHDKLQSIIQHVIDINVDNFKPEEGTDIIDLPLVDITRMITNLTITSGSSLRSYEVRLEELETRVTQLNGELAKLLKLKLKVENGLKDMELMYKVEDLRVQAKRLWYDCCSTHIFAVPKHNEPVYTNGYMTPTPAGSEYSSRAPSADGERLIEFVHENTIPPDHLIVLKPRARSISLTPKDSENEDLQPPERKMPGETHIFDMHDGLRSVIIRSLSKRKGNGNDWRLIADRVGIPVDLKEQWLRMRAPNAMALVMKVWGDSLGATVRMLHRHLSSPQMKSVMLAKMISDFYDVD